MLVVPRLPVYYIPTFGTNEKFAEVIILESHVKDRPLVEVRSLENRYFYPIPASVFRFYCCYALAAKGLVPTMILVIDLFNENNFHFRCFKIKQAKESKGEVNILLGILLLERILKDMKNICILEQFIKGNTTKKLFSISII